MSVNLNDTNFITGFRHHRFFPRCWGYELSMDQKSPSHQSPSAGGGVALQDSETMVFSLHGIAPEQWVPIWFLGPTGGPYKWCRAPKLNDEKLYVDIISLNRRKINEKMCKNGLINRFTLPT